MLSQFIEKINNFLEEQKVAIRRVVSSYIEKISFDNMSERTRDLHILNNIVLPSQIKTSGIMVGKIVREWLDVMKKDSEDKACRVFIANAKLYLDNLIKEVNDFCNTFNKEQAVIQSKEKQIIGKITELHKRTMIHRKPSLLHRILLFWRWKERESNIESITRELMQLNGTLAFLRIRVKTNNMVIRTLNEFEDYLSNQLLQKIKIIEGKLTQALVLVESELSQVNEKISNAKGYQIDLHTRNKIYDIIRARMNENTVESVSGQTLPELERKDVQGIVDFVKAKLVPLFRDLDAVGAMQRLCELYPKNDTIGTFFQSLTAKEGSPYCPLNNRLLDQTPLAISSFGIADTDMNNRIENVVDGRVSKGSYGVSLQPDANKIICITSIHRIPIFALSQFSEYMIAVVLKQRYSRYAVYPERRWQEYAPVEPSTKEIQVENILALGFASGLIEYHDQGWYQVNGYKIRGIAELRSRLSTDAKFLNRIKDWWTDMYSTSGINGVLQELENGENRAASVNGVSKTVQSIKTRLEKLNGENLSRERFLNVLTSIE